MGELIADLGSNLGLYKVHVDEIREQDVNARVMPPEMFERLVSTIKNDGRLEQLPFCVVRKDNFELISGHHRYRAARAAGLSHIFVLGDASDLSRSKVVAKQLAHNTISGSDDKQTLAKLYAEMQSVEDVLESYLKPSDFDGVSQLEPSGVSDISVAIPWKQMTLVFLPVAFEKLELIEKAVKKVPRESDTIGLVSMEIYDRFRQCALNLSRTEDVRALGAILTRMVEITEAHLAQAGGHNEQEDGSGSAAAAQEAKPKGKRKVA